MNIALVGNPNSGKTSLFNLLTGSNQYVGNWPGVTVEKRRIVEKNPNIHIQDLPGIYSLSPYTPEEVIARDYLVHEQPELIINIIDATNLERNLYLTTQLLDLDIPMIIGLNMMDVIKKKEKNQPRKAFLWSWCTSFTNQRIEKARNRKINRKDSGVCKKTAFYSCSLYIRSAFRSSFT